MYLATWLPNKDLANLDVRKRNRKLCRNSDSERANCADS
jgi:hypothetical protein